METPQPKFQPIVEIEIPNCPGTSLLARMESGSIHKALQEALPILREANKLDASASPRKINPIFRGHQKKRPFLIQPDGTPLASHLFSVLVDAQAISLMVDFRDQYGRTGTLHAHRREIF